MKKMTGRKLLAAGMAALCLGMAFPAANTMAADVSVVSEDSESGDDGVMTCADQIGYIYRIHNGRVQRRLWNYTDGRWYSSKWEDVGPA